VLLRTLRVASACRLGVVIETKHSSHMDHGGLFDGPAERYEACNTRPAMHRLGRGQSRPSDSNKSNALTIAEWIGESTIRNPRFAQQELQGARVLLAAFMRSLHAALVHLFAANVIFPQFVAAWCK
jgi:hypothetical protein